MFGLRNWFAVSSSGTAASVSKPKAWLDDEEDSLIPPRELWVGPDDPINHYLRWPWEYLAYLTVAAGMHREAAVLELGCGHGRTMRGLLSYLRWPGRYVGLDVDKPRIEDAQRRITARWGNFEFVWADVHNAQNNPTGIEATSYRFPFGDDAFDIIYAASLFTHLLPDEAQHYLRESRRVLKPGGRVLFSWFLLDSYKGPGTTVSPLYEFEHAFPGHDDVAVRDPKHPDAAIGFRCAAVEALAVTAGLRIVHVFPGQWHESPGIAVNEQDMVLMTRD